MCQVEMKLIRAGVSKKTNKPYKAFYKCEECGGTVNAGAEAEPAPKISKPVFNGDNLGMMRLAYRKDLMVALVNKMTEHTDANSVIIMFNTLWAEVEK